MRSGVRYIMGLLWIVLLAGCSAHGVHREGTHPVDELNRMSYAWRYRNLDSAVYYASKAYEQAGHYVHGRTVACNMLGFVAFMQMDYEGALHWYEEVDKRSGCELERFVADVGQMKVFQRTADNLAFYNSRVKAMARLRHINEEVEGFSPSEFYRLQSMVNELHMVTALHHYMMGQRPEAHAEMNCVVEDDVLLADSAQWLMYTYIKGLGLDVEGDTREQRLLRRYSYLNNCLRSSHIGGFAYFEGVASLALSQLLADSIRMSYIAQRRPTSFALLEDSVGGANRLCLNLVNDALSCLKTYGGRYDEMNAMVQMASLYNRMGNYEEALDTLQCVLDRIACIYAENYLPTDSIVSLPLYDAFGTRPLEIEWLSSSEGRTIPDVLCRLREEASLAFSGLGDKVASDFNRNIYLDLLEMTRQDKELESRYLSLKRQRRTMNFLLIATLTGATLLIVLVWGLAKRKRRHGRGYEQQLRELMEEAEKRVYLHHRHIDEAKRDNIKRKASFSIVTGIIPYIDRMAHEVDRLQQPEVWANGALRTRKLEYIGELTSEINRQNEILARWIQTTHGMISLHIESFPLSEVFAMIERGGTSFTLKGLSLTVNTTDAVVKADKALTFFMLNTLADNARKFTPSGGQVTVSAEVCDDYVELSVADDGIGMSAEDIDQILHNKVYNASAIGRNLSPEQCKNKGSGFGLLNCKGIIEKYRKTDSFFEVCRMGIESRVGEGSRFWFRLPKGIRRTLLLLGMLVVPFITSANVASYDTLLVQASVFADSVYYANVEQHYEEALRYADSAIHYLNTHHRKYASEYIAPLTTTVGEMDTELRWWLSDYATDYHTILDIRNELAVANLALRRWNDYRYNNTIYNDLYKLVSEDRTLIDYCNRMQRYNSSILMAILLCALLVIGYLCIIAYAFMGRVESAYRDMESIEDDERRARHEDNRLHVQNMVLDNCLSTIKHETVYYPNRIRQLVGCLNSQDERSQMKELIGYYKVLFSTLTGCASRQIEEISFRRSEITSDQLLQYAAAYHAKCILKYDGAEHLSTLSCMDSVYCDISLVHYLLEQLIDAALALSPTDRLTLKTEADGEFVRFTLVNTSRVLEPEVLQNLFYPTSSFIDKADGGCLQGAEYLVCRQIIREHDTYFNHIGCRIKAEPLIVGYAIWFTLPKTIIHHT